MGDVYTAANSPYVASVVVAPEVPPVLVSATIEADGATMTCLFSQVVTSIDFTVGMSLTADLAPVAINTAIATGDIVTYGIDHVISLQECALSYDSGTGDIAGTWLPLASFSASVTNNSTAFNPVALFSGGEQGGIYDPSDFATMFQDTAGTVPVTATGQPVGKILDLSPNGNHLTATSDPARPLLQQDGNGFYYLEGDGIDNRLRSAAIDASAFRYAVMAAGVQASGGSFDLWGGFTGTGAIDQGGYAVVGRTTTGNSTTYAGNGGGSFSATVSIAPPASTMFASAISIDFQSATDTIMAFRPFLNGALQSYSGASFLPVDGNMNNGYRMYLLSTPAAGNPLFGRLYRSMFRFSTAITSDADLLALNEWINDKMSAY